MVEGAIVDGDRAVIVDAATEVLSAIVGKVVPETVIVAVDGYTPAPFSIPPPLADQSSEKVQPVMVVDPG